MIGLMQIMIYLFCVYLVYKGCEIFQIAFVSRPENSKVRIVGIVCGILSIAAAIVIAVGAIWMTEDIVSKIGDKMNNLPSLR